MNNTSSKKYSFSLSQTLDDVDSTANNFKCIPVEKNGEIKYVYDFTENFNRNKYIKDNIQIIYDNRDIVIDNGIYIWVILSCGDETYFIYIKTLSIHEFGTKHSNLIIDYFINNSCTLEKTVVHYSGEFQKTDSGISINFASGTYMLGIDPTNRQQYFEEVKEFLEDHNVITPAFQLLESDKETVIREDTLPKMTYELLKQYTMYGIKFILFNTVNECQDYDTNRSKHRKYAAVFKSDKNAWDRWNDYPSDHPRKRIKPKNPVFVEDPLTIILNDPSIEKLGFEPSISGGRLNKRRRKSRKTKMSRVKNVKRKTRVKRMINTKRKSYII